MSYQEAIAQDARLLILRELAKQVDGQLNEVALRRVLDVYGIVRSRDWLVTQLNRLAELEALSVKNVGELQVATLMRPGRDHVEERMVISGVTRPSELG